MFAKQRDMGKQLKWEDVFDRYFGDGSSRYIADGTKLSDVFYFIDSYLLSDKNTKIETLTRQKNVLEKFSRLVMSGVNPEDAKNELKQELDKVGYIFISFD